MLAQLNKMYNLGRSCGWSYIHSPLPPPEHCSYIDIIDFLGIDFGHEACLPPTDPVYVDIDAYDLASELNKGNYPDSSFLKSRSVEGSLEKVVIRICWNFKLYPSQPDCIPIRIHHNLVNRERFVEKNHVMSWKGREIGDALLIAVHIRRGDSTWIKHGSRFYFPQYNYSTINLQDGNILRAPPIERFIQILDLVMANMPRSRKHIIYVFSDGHQFFSDPLTIRGIIGVLVRLALTPSFWPGLWALIREYDKFNAFGSVKFRIGNSPSLTKEGARCFAAADICISGQKSETAFPGFGLSDPKTQLSLWANDPVEENLRKIVDYFKTVPI